MRELLDAPDVTTLLAAVARYDPDKAQPLMIEPLDDLKWRSLLQLCEAHRLVGLLGAAVDLNAVPATDEQARLLASAHLRAMTIGLMVERLLLRAATVLDDAAIPYRVLKGPAVAHLDWPDPSLRIFNDVDVLLDHAQYNNGINALIGLDCRRRTPEVHSGFDRRFGKGTTLVSIDGYELDVHRTLAAGAFGLLVKQDELMDSPDTFMLGGRSIPALGRPQRLIHACYHGVLGDAEQSLGALRDVAQMAADSTAEDQRAVHDLARSWEGEAPVAAALLATRDSIGLDAGHPLVAWAASFEPSSVEARRMVTYSTIESRFGREAIEGLRALPKMRDRVAYVRYLAFPSREHLDTRSESPMRRLFRGLKLAKGR
jgi:hypothetical protein